MEITIKEIINAVNGKLLCGDENSTITDIQYDSREVKSGALFVPIIGENVDAHKFISQCFESGAGASFTQYENTEKNGALIYVNDTKKALQDLASWYRDKFSCPIIGITGSVGKTTTKEMIYSALATKLNVMKTKGNQNSQIGLPITVFNIKEENDCAVIEMGMSMFGEMEKLADIAKPNYAVMTNIGVSHIENLKTQENILKEKINIAKHFDNNSILFVNGDDEYLKKASDYTSAKIVTFGISENCDYRAENISYTNNSAVFTMINGNEKETVELNVIGKHNVLNALAAFAVGHCMGVDTQSIKIGLKGYNPPPLRQQIHKLESGITVIDDSYNASPDSVRSAVNVLASINNNGRKIAVLADMLELGDIAVSEHIKIGEYLAENNIDIAVTVGDLAENIAKGFESIKKNIAAKSFVSNKDAYLYIKSVIKNGDTILIKGSRGMKTDEIVKNILNDFKE